MNDILRSRLLLLGVGAVCVCFMFQPFRGIAMKAIDRGPLSLRDGKTGAAIARCLVIPRYSAVSGIGTGAGHGPGWVHESSFVAHPFIYNSGSPFEPIERGGGGLSVRFGTVTVGRGWGIDAVLIVARGYQPSFVWSLHGPREEIVLTPLDEESWLAESSRFRQLLHGDQILGGDRRAFGFGNGGGDLAVRLDRKERDLVAEYLR